MWTKKLLFLSAMLPTMVLTPALAQTGTSSSLKLSLGFPRQDGVVNGSVSGSYSLSDIAKFDQKKRPCLGFSASTPDHVIVLAQSFPQLSFQVNSRGKDTTILIKMPNGQVFCGDDSDTGKDANLVLKNLPAGEYSVWVGSIESNKRWSYSLTLSEK